jgi:hypothetical protein
MVTLQINDCSEILMEDILCRAKLQDGGGGKLYMNKGLV